MKYWLPYCPLQRKYNERCGEEAKLIIGIGSTEAARCATSADECRIGGQIVRVQSSLSSGSSWRDEPTIQVWGS